MRWGFDAALNLSNTLRQVASEEVSLSDEVVFAETGDATYEVDLPLEAAVDEFFREQGCDAVVVTEDRGEVLYGEDPELMFLIDPLDGSRNARRGLPFYGSSVAVFEAGAKDVSDAVYAVVSRFDADEVFTAEKGKGAFLNGDPITASDVSSLSDAVVAAGSHFASSYHLLSDLFAQLGGGSLVPERDVWVKCLGATAVELAYLACGRLDAVVDVRAGVPGVPAPKTYDVAAGLLLCREAGAQTVFGGEKLGSPVPVDPSYRVQLVCAGTGSLFNTVLNTLQ